MNLISGLEKGRRRAAHSKAALGVMTYSRRAVGYPKGISQSTHETQTEPVGWAGKPHGIASGIFSSVPAEEAGDRLLTAESTEF